MVIEHILCNTLQHTAAYCNTLQLSSDLTFEKVYYIGSCYLFIHRLQHTATHCNCAVGWLLRTSTTSYPCVCSHIHCNTLQHTATEQWADFWVYRVVFLVMFIHVLQHTATYCNVQTCNTLQLSSELTFQKFFDMVSLCMFTHTLQDTAAHCNTLQHTTTLCNWAASWVSTRSSTWCTFISSHTHCNALQHTATICNWVASWISRRSTMWCPFISSHTHCNTLQHVASHCDWAASCLLRSSTSLKAAYTPVTRPCKILKSHFTTKFTSYNCYRPGFWEFLPVAWHTRSE